MFWPALLLSAPDLLLLDEPTNHLDIEATEWLEDYLKIFPGLSCWFRMTAISSTMWSTSIWEMTPAIEEYRGNYSAYVTQREERYQPPPGGIRCPAGIYRQGRGLHPAQYGRAEHPPGTGTPEAPGTFAGEARLTPPAKTRQFKLQPGFLRSVR